MRKTITTILLALFLTSCAINLSDDQKQKLVDTISEKVEDRKNAPEDSDGEIQLDKGGTFQFEIIEIPSDSVKYEFSEIKAWLKVTNDADTIYLIPLFE